MTKSQIVWQDSRFGDEKVDDFRVAEAHSYPKMAGGDFSE